MCTVGRIALGEVQEHTRSSAERSGSVMVTAPSPSVAGCSDDDRIATDDGEHGAGTLAAVPELVGACGVRQLDRVGVADQLEPDADRQARRRDGVAGQAREVARVGTG